MGTRRKVAIWWAQGPGVFRVIAPGMGKAKDVELTFTKQSQMLEFARSARLILKQAPKRGVYGGDMK